MQQNEHEKKDWINNLKNDFKVYVKKRDIIRLIVLIASVILFVVIAEDIAEHNIAVYDSFVYQALIYLQCDFCNVLFRICTNLVNPILLALISFGFMFMLKQKRYLLPLAGNLILPILLNVCIKDSFKRDRPFDVIHIVNESGYSFPSGHSMLAACFYGFLIFMIWNSMVPKKYKVVITFACSLIICLVGCSRIYLGAHYASDVLGGFLVSVMYLMVYTTVVEKYFQAGRMELEAMAASKAESEGVYEHGDSSLIMSFKRALDGVVSGISSERNLMLHFLAAFLVIIFGVLLDINKMEWCVCTITCAFVIALELINTAIETLADLIDVKKNPKIKLAKDTASGAVFCGVVGALIVAAIIFFPKVWDLITQLIVF